ncbi:YlbG family protein [Sporosarcina siberiensis]|uniref:YlbG family protein n=1 Tax=Sporosarcina siberiensis TaxID=1365606 RepID=A0ABW4SHD3_9BACL
MVDRQGIIIYLHHLRQAKSFRKYGHVHYISRKMKYVVLYCDKEDIDAVINKVERLPSVKKVVPSYKPLVKTFYENAKPDKAKEYDYKTGL